MQSFHIGFSNSIFSPLLSLPLPQKQINLLDAQLWTVPMYYTLILKTQELPTA